MLSPTISPSFAYKKVYQQHICTYRYIIHQQHICTYTYIIHQQLHHSNSTSIIMIINEHHHNQHQNIIMSIINIHTNINNITTNQQLHIISHNSSKGENTSYYDKHHIQHPAIIHTSTFNHIKLFIKDMQDIRP